ncbi:F-box domain-containing protein [Colletotrichum godetiae]|uniref:F-box domain-containing protein n=1 Tax=Colletotrichum godetiae TaxID=1209918 RepID=A0AAJ0AC38_9PEZI|nr:F-box domain-containing protein [Colletotrichum godetiae]KAK1671052.1 F-box domain-containing protein [Colletotrichum godetiae]
MSQPTPSASEPSTSVMNAPANPQPNSPFNRVPLEVLIRISDQLATPDLGSLRLTCRSIEQSMFNTFMGEFFTQRQFMLTEFSLQTLIDISKSRLSDCLHYVIIGLNTFTRHYFSPGEEAKETRYREAQSDHYTLVNSGQDVSMLTEAFRNLRNLKTVGIRDYHSSGRNFRDGFSVDWTSYGATTLQRETGVNLLRIPVDEMVTYTNKVFVTLFTALGNAGARPSAFELLRHQQGVPSDDAFNLFTKYLKPKVVPVLEGLETFICVLNVATGPFRVTSLTGSTGSSERRRYDYLLRLFLGYMPNLKHLRTNFAHPGHNTDAVDEFIDWLGTPALNPPSEPDDNQLPTPPAPVAFSHLEEINLGFVEVEPRRLLQVVQKFAPTLRNLELWKVTLRSRTGAISGDYDTRSNISIVNMWARFLQSLRDVPNLDLNHIMVGCPAQRMSMTSARVWVQVTDGVPDKSVGRREYTGIDWRHFVGELAKQVMVDIPPEYERSSDSDDEDEEDMDDGIDDDLDEDMFDAIQEDIIAEGYLPDEIEETLDDYADAIAHEQGFHQMMFQ